MNRRNFLKQTIAMAGAALLSPAKVLSGVVSAGESWLGSGMVLGVDLANSEDWSTVVIEWKDKGKFYLEPFTFIHQDSEWNLTPTEGLDHIQATLAEIANMRPSWGIMLADITEEDLAQEEGGFLEVVRCL